MNRRSGFSMMALLVALFLFAVITASTTSLVVNGLRRLSLSEKRAQMNQLIPTLQAAWQSTLRGTDSATWHMEGGTLVAEPLRITREEKNLLIENGDRLHQIYMPPIVDTTMTIERHPTLADCAVLDLYWESRFLSGVTTNRVRFVACGRSTP